MKTIYKLLSLAGLLMGTAPLVGQTVPLDVEVGFRVVRVSGSSDEYRTQINERPGILLRNITFATSDFDGRTNLVDHLRVDGSDLGAGPAGALRLEAGRSGLWSLRFSYRHADFFSALPDFANPLFPTVIPGQHTIDRVRDLYDAEVELFPGHVITPLIGYTRNTYSGPGRTTYHVGDDEFRLASNLDDIDQEVRVGANFAAGPVSGRIVQGWRQFRETESLALAPGEKNGNNPGPILGVGENLANLNRENSVKTNTPSTTALVTGRIGPRLRLIGSYQRATAEADTNETEALAGSLVSFEISRFFAGLTETASTRSKATFWRGSGRAELTVTDGVDFTVGWSRRHRYLDGFALVSSLYLNTVTFAGADPKDLLKLLQAQNAMDRTDNHFETRLSARGIGPWSGHVSWAETREDVVVTPDLSEIVVPGGQGGDFGRRVAEWSAGLGFTRSAFTFGADWIGERANDPIVRTDFLDRDRYRLRLSWTDAPTHLRVSATGQQLDASNDRPGIGYDGRIREYGGEIEFTPVQPLRARFSASKYQADSRLLDRLPEDFTTAVSDHRERGASVGGDITLTLKWFTLDGSYGRFQNKGSYPFTIDRARASAEIPVRAGIGLIAEWMRDKYNDAAQDTGSLAKFAANRYGLYLRWQPRVTE
jgi:hypothetical protein